MNFNEKEFQTVILAALLHDIGKISQREGGEYFAKHADFSGNFISSLRTYFGDDFAKDIANLIEKHHGIPSNRNEYILHIADKLAAAERIKEEREQFKSNEAALLAITSRIKFRVDRKEEKYYKLSPLRIEREVLFPVDKPFVEEGAYKRLWDGFVGKIRLLKKYKPSDFITIFYILKEFGTFVPSATPWEESQYN
ncbi:MAG: HD domain-containing protein, partial [Thermodesulfobacteriota bacterium]